MDQKNTIVKCNRSPKCLFEHNGVCDNYVISIGEDGKCDCYVETEPIREQKTCQEDCIHFDDSDPMVGPICLFKHPEPLKEFYKDMPCDYYHKRGQRAKCNFYDDACDEKPEIKIPDSKDTDIHFVIQNAWCNEELLRDQMCWFCDNGEHEKCSLTVIPALDRTGKCPFYKSTGGNR